MDFKATVCLFLLLGTFAHLSSCGDAARLFRRDVTEKSNEQSDGEPIRVQKMDKPKTNEADTIPNLEAGKMSNDVIPPEEGDIANKNAKDEPPMTPMPEENEEKVENDPNLLPPKPLPMLPRFPNPDRPLGPGWFNPNFDNMPLPQPFGFPTIPNFYPPWNIPTPPSLEYPVYDLSPGNFASATSFVSSGGPGGSTSISTNSQTPGFASRGAFPSNDDAPQNSFGNPSGGASYAGYSPQGSTSYSSSSAGSAGFPKGPVPSFNNGNDFQNFLQQYFSAMQAQQEAFQAQLQAQLRAQQQAIFELSNRLDASANANRQYAPQFNSRFGETGDQPGGTYTSTQFGPHSASASASIGPGGGYQAAQINPASPGIFSRFGEDIPAPSGGSYGVFSSSSSSHSVGPDGKQTAFKTATTGVNDNGRISFKTVHEP